MKKMQIYLIILSIFLLFLSNFALASSIIVDGFPDAGWANTDIARSPDKDTDAPSGDNNANIIDNYITDNGTELFLRFDVAGEIFGGPTTNIHYEYYAYIDADNNPATGSTDPWYSPIGSDYYIYLSGGNHAFQDKQLYKWNGSTWALTSATVTAAVGCDTCAEKNILEIGVNLADIGSPSCKMAFAFSAIEGTNWGGDFNNDANADGILYTVSTCPGKSIDGMIDDWDGSELTALDACETCIPDTVNMRQVGITFDAQNLYVRTTLQDTAFWGQGYKEYRIWIDVDPTTTNGYQPYIDTTSECMGNPLCIAWPNFYADYHITVATDAGGSIEETISQKLFLDCSANDCSQTSSFIPLNGNKFESATGWKYIEFKIPLSNIPVFDPDCFEIALTTYDKNSLNICNPPGDNLPDWGGEGIGITTGCSTLITLASFEAAAKNNKVILLWKTESEINNAGFNIYRSESENGEYTKINASLIPAQGSPANGVSYKFVDTGVTNRQIYYYKLEDIDLNGTSTMHGPASATPKFINLFGLK